MSNILIVDDESDIRDIISDTLADEGYKTFTAANAKTALDIVTSSDLDLVVLDIWLEGSEFDGIGVLKRIKQLKPCLPVIMISGHGNIETAVETIKYGAYDFIEKPFKAEKLLILTKRAIEVSKLSRENDGLKKQQLLSTRIDGVSKEVINLLETAKTLANSESRVIINGETGTGKENFARMIHRFSKRSNTQFVTLYANSISQNEIDSELFGVENGSNIRVGLLEKADGGILFIDEFSDMPQSVQSKLLVFLQEKKFRRVGSNKEVSADIRIIAATSKDLKTETENGKLNESLFYRLNVANVTIAPLRERKEDIRILIEIFIKQFSETLGLQTINLLDDTLAYLEMYNWPGNVRQLRNMVEWLMLIKKPDSRDIRIEDLPADISGQSSESKIIANDIITKPLKVARDMFEREYLQAQLERFNHNISKTADYIGMERTALHRKIKQLNIDEDSKKKA